MASTDGVPPLTRRRRRAETGSVTQVSRPLQIVLLVTVVFAAAWLVVLRPRAGGGEETAAAPETAPSLAVPAAGSAGGSAPAAARPEAPGAQPSGADGGNGGAHAAGRGREREGRGAGAARGSSAGAGRAARGDVAEADAIRGSSADAAAPAARSGADRRLAAARAALRDRRTLALAFVENHAADSRGLVRELATVDRRGGRVTTLAVPISELARYGFVTRGIDVTVAPTTVVVSPRRRATAIVGFADRAELSQHVADALR